MRGAMSRDGSVPDTRALRRAIMVLTLVWAAVLAPQLFGRQVFVLGDARVYRPFSEYSRERWLEKHERTFWNPYVFEGLPATASLADMRPQYLPDAALDVFERVRLGRFVPLGAPLLAHLAGMCGVAALAWAIWGLPTFALVWAGLAWGLSPLLLVPLAFGHDAYVVAVSLLPVSLLALERLFAAPRLPAMLAAALLLAGTLGLQTLTGHPQIVAYSGATLLAFALERAVRTREWPRLGLVFGALAWGAAISMAVWWPALNYAAHSVRAEGMRLGVFLDFSLGWRELLAGLWPQAVGGAGDTYWGGMWTTDYPRFFGSSVVLLAAIAMVGRGKAVIGRRGFWGALALVSLGVAMGPRLGPVFYLIHDHVPLVKGFRVVSMVLVLAGLTLALLSAAGVARALGPVNPERKARGSMLTAGAVFAALALIGLGIATLGAGAYAEIARAARSSLTPELALLAARRAGIDLAWRAILMGAVWWLVVVRPWRSATVRVGTVLVALLLCDLLPVSFPTLRRASASAAVLDAEPEPALARFGREAPAIRVLSMRRRDNAGWEVAGLGEGYEMQTNSWIRWRAHAHGGEHGSPPSVWEERTFLGSTGTLRVLGIGYLSSPADSPQDSSALQLVASTPSELVYRLRDALSRAFTVPRVEKRASDPEVVRDMLTPDFDGGRVAYTTDDGAAGEYPGSAGAQLEWLADAPDSLVLRVRATADAFVVVADTWFPGWSAMLDGSAVEIHRVNHAFRGIAVPAGEHVLTMVYRPEGWVLGLGVTRWAGALWLLSVVAGLFAALAIRRTSHQSPA